MLLAAGGCAGIDEEPRAGESVEAETAAPAHGEEADSDTDDSPTGEPTGPEDDRTGQEGDGSPDQAAGQVGTEPPVGERVPTDAPPDGDGGESRQTGPTPGQADADAIAFRVRATVPIADWGGRTTPQIPQIAYDAAGARLLVAGLSDGTIKAIDVADLSAPVTTTVTPDLPGRPTAIAVGDGLIAVTMATESVEEPGTLIITSPDGTVVASVSIGPGPVFATFSPDGRYLVTANEGNANGNYSIDPIGSLSLVALQRVDGSLRVSDDQVRTIVFEEATAEPTVRSNGPRATFEQDMEPTRVVFSPEGEAMYVLLSENNAIAKVAVVDGTVEWIRGLGAKDHGITGNGIDPSDADGQAAVAAWPIYGLFQPTGADVFDSDGERFLITANGGAPRVHATTTDAVQAADARKSPGAFRSPDVLFAPEALGRLKVSSSEDDLDGDGALDVLYGFGARSVAIWTDGARILWDSGDLFEQTAIERVPGFFNAGIEGIRPDSRSDDQGPEPMDVVVGTLAGRPTAFVSLYGDGGIAALDLSDPYDPVLTGYYNGRNRDAAVDEDGYYVNPAEDAGPVGPSTILFLDENTSPSGAPLLVVAYAASGTVVFYDVVRL